MINNYIISDGLITIFEDRYSNLVVNKYNLSGSMLNIIINYCNKNLNKTEFVLKRLICESLKEITLPQRVMLFYLLDSKSFLCTELDKLKNEEYFNNVIHHDDIAEVEARLSQYIGGV